MKIQLKYRIVTYRTLQTYINKEKVIIMKNPEITEKYYYDINCYLFKFYASFMFSLCTFLLPQRPAVRQQFNKILLKKSNNKQINKSHIALSFPDTYFAISLGVVSSSQFRGKDSGNLSTAASVGSLKNSTDC
jgi:hypothetical protein